MATSATFQNMSLTTAFNCDTEKSLLSLDWVLNSGICAVCSVASGILTIPCVNGAFSVQMNLPVVSSLTSDLVLGQDWLQYCRESVPQTCFYLTSGPIDLRRAPTVHSAPPQAKPGDINAGSMEPEPEPESSRRNEEHVSDCLCITRDPA
ncbi:hypothetical protein B0H17DRAFT_1186156 [Mycena rosella]|uniref:Uncharacterized protein n=2 Tax=Mycena rosella TaxID=1033263 RepID=A0AAD7CNB9_MYCRO|nr:hypothetical protein B0H17DRAFT_1186156 [Mycena rosella]